MLLTAGPIHFDSLSSTHSFLFISFQFNVKRICVHFSIRINSAYLSVGKIGSISNFGAFAKKLLVTLAIRINKWWQRILRTQTTRAGEMGAKERGKASARKQECLDKICSWGRKMLIATGANELFSYHRHTNTQRNRWIMRWNCSRALVLPFFNYHQFKKWNETTIHLSVSNSLTHHATELLAEM